jgi:hypothetical protein
VSENKDKQLPEKIEPVGAAGPVGEGQVGTPLHKPSHVRNRERVGAGGPIGEMDIGDTEIGDLDHVAANEP